MVPHYGKEKGIKANMGLWCKLGIRRNVNDSFLGSRIIAGLSTSEPGRWLGIPHWTGRLICYHIITQTGKGISRSMVQRVTNIELSTG